MLGTGNTGLRKNVGQSLTKAGRQNTLVKAGRLAQVRPSGTRDKGKKIQDCPGDWGTVGAYGIHIMDNENDSVL